MCTTEAYVYVLYSGKVILNVMDLLSDGIALYGTLYIHNMYILE